MKNTGLILVGFLLGTSLFWGFSFQQHTSIHRLSKKANIQEGEVTISVENDFGENLSIDIIGGYSPKFVEIQNGETHPITVSDGETLVVRHY